ncbi:DUF5776 domain-containing protein, partial [Carnobacterium divergens]|uniref:peptidoglycan amidohydrolase family protein n=1 Tax=Carnobacterium divergens TaxID=2748 RepID=UPI00288ECB39
MANIETMIKWMKDREGKVTYDMNNRLGPNSYDCSSAVYFSLRAGGFLPAGSMGNTDSLFGHLEQNKWIKVPLTNGSYAAKRGDIFIWGTRGASGGASGHTGIFVDSANIIHCNYGYNGITTNNHDLMWGYNQNPPITVYRYSVPQIDLSKYFTSNPGFVKTITDCSYYTNTDFTTKKSDVPKGTIVKVHAVEYSKAGYPRLKCEKGYLTANKSYVQQQSMTNYFLTNPNFIKTLQDDYYYTSSSFSTKKELIAKGVIVRVLNIEFSSMGYPRLKCEKGYLTANKTYVQQQDMKNYFTSNPGFVKTIQDDYYYTSAEFSTKKEPIAKGVIVKVLGIEFSKWGIPRLKCEKGYLSANKAYIQQQDMSNYFTVNPGFVKAIQDDFYYTSAEFST